MVGPRQRALPTGSPRAGSAEVRPFEPITQEACIFFEDYAVSYDEEVQIQSVDESVGAFVQMDRVADAHSKARDAQPISTGAARYAKADPVRHGAGRRAFRALVTRHIGDASVVLGSGAHR